MITVAFTCTGPYAILIMLGIKRVENRSVMPNLSEGRCAVGCSKSFCKEEFGEFVKWASQHLKSEDFRALPSWGEVEDWPGKIIGACDYVSSVDAGDGKWNEGYPFWWRLSNVVCFENPIPCRGNVGMWQMSPSLSAAVTSADIIGQLEGQKVASVEDAVRIFKAALSVVNGNEGLFVLPLDDSRCVLSAPILVALGDSKTAAIQPGEVFAEALKVESKAIIVAHNHPSGDTTASIQDKLFTEELMRMGSVIGVEVLDHLILAGDKYVSAKLGSKRV